MAGNGNGTAGARRRRARRHYQRSNHNGGGLPKWAYVVLGVGALGLMAMTAVVITAVTIYNSYADDLVAPDELAINQPSYGAKIYDRSGKLLYEYVDDRSGLRRPVKLEGVSPAFLAATIATEDDSFFTNPGVNIRGLGRAAWENFSPLSNTPGVLGGSGGSSITQQLVKNVYIPQEERSSRSVSKGIPRKIKETVYAMELTRRYTKEKILEWYVNQISYGGLYNGVEAAAQGYFGKSAAALTLGEAALLAGIPQSPAAYDPVNYHDAAIERRNTVLDLLARHGQVQVGEDAYFTVTPEEIEAAKAEELHISEKRFPIDAPHFVLQYVEPQLRRLFGCPLTSDEKCDPLLREGLVVTTTLDLDLQHRANEILEKWVLEFETVSNSHNGAVVVMDPKTGEILVMVGSRDYFREDILGKNNNATSLNSPGSAFKPFVYLTSFLKLNWGPGSIILDTPVSYPQSDGTVFTPTNPGKNFQGPITIRNALGNSLNIPAIKTADQVGIDNIVAQAKKMGFTTVTGNYGPSIATGGIDLTAVDMVYGYTVLANNGVMRGQSAMVKHRPGERNLDPISILKVTDSGGQVRYEADSRRREERIEKPEYAYLVTSILTDPRSQCITFGCGGITVPGYTVAVKTGTSEPFDPRGPNAFKIGDTWGFGYTPDYAVGVWAGNSDNAPIVNIFSTSISFRAMRDIMIAAYNGRPQTPFQRPEGVVEETVCVPSGMKATPLCGKTTTDLFVKDALPKDDDTWWRRVRVDIRNGLLAGPTTPPQFVEEKVMLVFPPDLMKTDSDKARAKDWAEALGLPLAPTEASTLPSTAGITGRLPTPGRPGDTQVLITAPTSGSVVSGRVQVNGRATSSGFDSFRLEYSSDASPGNWSLISQASVPVDSGPLGVWDTSSLPNGTYALRLVVIDRQRGLIISTVTVTVGTPPPTAVPPTLP